MKRVTFRLRPLSPFGTPLVGDTLFGQLCWAIHNIQGPGRLADLLEGYTANRPFAVVSDAFPAGYVRRPEMPVTWLYPLSGTDTGGSDRKAFRKRVWLPLRALQDASNTWHECLTDTPISRTQVPAAGNGHNRSRLSQDRFLTEEWQPHNQIDRCTGTTGSGDEGFAPFVTQQWRYAQDATVDIHACYDPARIEAALLEEALRSIGNTGYGANATTGMGRFAIEAAEHSLPHPSDQANAWLTLAPCAPQSQDFTPDRSWYRVCTRFGRHGDIGALSSAPFKAPILLAQSGAVFSPCKAFAPRCIIGQGLGQKDNPISHFMPEAVHQGYAPVLAIQLADHKDRPS